MWCTKRRGQKQPHQQQPPHAASAVALPPDVDACRTHKNKCRPAWRPACWPAWRPAMPLLPTLYQSSASLRVSLRQSSASLRLAFGSAALSSLRIGSLRPAFGQLSVASCLHPSYTHRQLASVHMQAIASASSSASASATCRQHCFGQRVGQRLVKVCTRRLSASRPRRPSASFRPVVWQPRPPHHHHYHNLSASC